jgi:hypothetical protein
MYFQVFLFNSKTAKWAQYSCDTFFEIQELLESKGCPKFIRVEYHNSFGLVGIAKKAFCFFESTYKTFAKESNAMNPHNKK